MMFEAILQAYGIDSGNYHVSPLGSGLINRTWKVAGKTDAFVLQQINTNIFTRPQDIANNLQLLNRHFKKQSSEYLFVAPLPTLDGRYLIQLTEGFFRLSPFISGSHTVDYLTKTSQAFQAAKQFGKFTALLHDFDVRLLTYTLPNFHNLSLRITKFQDALAEAPALLKEKAKSEIEQVQKLYDIAERYENICKHREIPLRVIHHDTKINNVLFDDYDNSPGIIDLDTVMPGYFISDVGDMMRTYLAAASEEEQDLDKISIREDFFGAIYTGYLTHMGGLLTAMEKELFIYSGKFMIYMQAVRFLTDYLQGDVYYHTKYSGQNLLRAKNQLRLLDLYLQAEPKFQQIIKTLNPVS